MDDNKEYEKFTKYLAKGYFMLNEVQKFIENEFVANVTQVGPDPKNKNWIKYNITLVDGDVYYVYGRT